MQGEGKMRGKVRRGNMVIEKQQLRRVCCFFTAV